MVGGNHGEDDAAVLDGFYVTCAETASISHVLNPIQNWDGRVSCDEQSYRLERTNFFFKPANPETQEM